VQIVQFGAGAPCPGDGDGVFKALADPTRRALLDRFRERSGQTLGELCEPLEMAGQSATQHLGVLEAANLITTVRRDREKLHYLNPVPPTGHPGTPDRQVRTTPPARAERHLHGTGAPNGRGSPGRPQGRAIRVRHFVATDRQKRHRSHSSERDTRGVQAYLSRSTRC
jgi:DNA-binding transcriptional ArsR family regulator